MSESYAEFHDRLARIYRKQSKTGRVGRESVVINRNGYMIVKGAGRRRGIPWAGLFTVVVSFFMIKGILMSQYGPDFYSQDVVRLSGGTSVEKAAAWTMSPDPVSRWISTQLNTKL
ncbi:hypothetical protein [Shimia sagamensis]|uniref:Uncharacterized protein n=1 Tax=Shimia sagamensis TaxID=1566352 RepID=A0ABY1P365_9RHOB|nr:hypothetical protein [Shimia sagamensis]SMP25292.1 hypothetical protein SAMN06265373_10587 [Shimia sagamensis]